MPTIIQDWDLSFLLWMRSCHDPIAVWSAWLVSTLAWKGVLFWAMALVLWLKGKRLLAVQLAVALLLGTIEVAGLKGLVLRPRPDLFASQQLNIPMPELLATTHSFPSGHTLLAAAAAAVFFASMKDWRLWVASVFVVLVGLARVFQGMHWATDVVGSIVLGIIAGAVAVQLSKAPFMSRLTGTRSLPASEKHAGREPAAAGRR